jgi:transcription elongation factor GreA
MEMITRDEKQTLQQKLDGLIANRPVISKRIAEARELGDLRENAEYHAAREDQGMQEAEIRRLTDRLANVSVMDDSGHKSTGVVFLGATVRLREVGCDELELFRLVGEASGAGGGAADYVEVTATSPMGEALMKARIGEVVSVRTPRGVKKFEVVEIV